MNALIWRDLKLTYRDKSLWVSGVIFFLLFLTLCSIAMGGQSAVLRPIAPALIWLAALFSQLLNLSNIFRNDIEDGSFEQLYLSGLSPLSIVSSKAIASFLIGYVPLIAAVPIAALFFGLTGSEIAGTMLSLLIGAVPLTCYGIFAAALMAGEKNASLMIILLTGPFMIPVLIFGMSAISSYPHEGLDALEFQALAGLGLIGIAAALPAAAAALSTYLD